MATAVRPGNGKSWEEVFEGYPDESPLWSLINNFLESYALDARFGFGNMPHDWEQNEWSDEDDCSRCGKSKEEHPIELTADERVLLTHYRQWRDSDEMDKFDPVDLMKQYHKEADKKKPNINIVHGMRFGLWLYYLVFLAKQKPEVGHFVGRGFDQNDKDAASWQKGA